MMRTVEPLAVTTSRAWDAARPVVSVVVATHNRAAWLPELLGALGAQRGAPSYEVVVADDGSADETWEVLRRLVADADVALCALRLAGSGGPSVPRNTGVATARGRVVAFTDDDCLPDPTWLAALTPAAQAGRIVQGRTIPADSGRRAPWDRAISVEALSGLWESCNVAVPRQRFEAAGGFPVLDLLGPGGRGFGEDAVLGATLAHTAGASWAGDAIVRHRWLPGDYPGYLRQMQRLVAMPAVVRAAPGLRAHCYGWLFRNRRAAACAAALAGLAGARTVRRPWPLVAAVPWLALLEDAARQRWGRPVTVRMAQEAVADLVALAACARGSVRARTPLL